MTNSWTGAPDPTGLRLSKVYRSVKKSCSFCIKRKRYCDGFARKRCSFCIAKKQPGCHYQLRVPTYPGVSTSKNNSARAHHDPSPMTGVSFWCTDEEGGNTSPAPADCTEEAAPLPPINRSRLTASPATGLVGLQEDGYLMDFFDCLGFLSLASPSIIRTAMVGVMFSAVKNPPSRIVSSSSSSSSSSSTSSSSSCSSSSCTDDDVEEGTPWSAAVTAGGGEGAPWPRDPSTCLMWCAIALGALVRGCPLEHVDSYVDLAQESLATFRDQANLDTARAYISMGFLHSFLGNEVKNHEYLESAKAIVRTLPPGPFPTGTHEILRYAGKGWVLSDNDLASAKEKDKYWQNVSPVWKLPNEVAEEDVRSLVLSVDVLKDQVFVEQEKANVLECRGGRRGSSGMALTEAGTPPQQRQQQQQPHRSGGAKTRVGRPATTLVRGKKSGATKKVKGGARQQRAEMRGDVTPPAAVAADRDEECKKGPRTALEVAVKMHRGALPEMLRLKEHFESSMRLDVGSLLYYMNLSLLQLVNHGRGGGGDVADAVEVVQRGLRVILRFPGLCRYKCWSHLCHTQLWCLALGPDREPYEELRAAYNPVRPSGSPLVPAFEHWQQGMSDICNHVHCRRGERMGFAPLVADCVAKLTPGVLLLPTLPHTA